MQRIFLVLASLLAGRMAEKHALGPDKVCWRYSLRD